jgi:hypothetical protein
MARCKIPAGYSLRRRYETNCCFPSAGRFKRCLLDASSSSEHHYRRKHAPGSTIGQEAAKGVKEISQETTESNEEIPESATESVPSHWIGLGIRPVVVRQCSRFIGRVPSVPGFDHIEITAKLRGQDPPRQEPREEQGSESQSFCRPGCSCKSLSLGCCSLRPGEPRPRSAWPRRRGGDAARELPAVPLPP